MPPEVNALEVGTGEQVEPLEWVVLEGGDEGGQPLLSGAQGGEGFDIEGHGSCILVRPSQDRRDAAGRGHGQGTGGNRSPEPPGNWGEPAAVAGIRAHDTAAPRATAPTAA